MKNTRPPNQYQVGLTSFHAKYYVASEGQKKFLGMVFLARKFDIGNCNCLFLLIIHGLHMLELE